MKIKTENWRGERIQDIEDHFSQALYGTSEGVAEIAGATAVNSCEALGRLVDLLAQRGLLNAADVLHISGAYSSSKPEFSA